MVYLLTPPDGSEVEPAVEWFLRLSGTGREGVGTAKTLGESQRNCE